MGADLDALNQSVKNVGANTASSFEQIADIASRASVAFEGLSGQPLEDLTKHVADFNRMTGETVNVRDFGEALRGFGVDGADAKDVLNELAAVSEQTLIPVNELVEATFP
jgi:phage-related minor tail protein